MKVLILGGTRFVGVTAVQMILDAGHDVTVFHRGSRQPAWTQPVRSILGDRNHLDALRELGRETYDAVIDFSAYNSEQTSTALAHITARRWIHCSTVNVVKPSPVLPWPEDIEYGPHPLWGQYAVEKIACEKTIFEQRAGTEAIILRFPLILGPRNFIPREEFVLNRILDHQPLLLPGDGQAVHQYLYRDHAAFAIARALEIPAADVEVFHVASKRCNTSLQGFVDVCSTVLDIPAETVLVGGGPTGEDAPVFNNADCVFPFSNENTILAIDKGEAAGLIAPFVDVHDMVAAAYDALLAEPGRRTWERTPAELRTLDRLDRSGVPVAV